jgi:hypothetical protein
MRWFEVDKNGLQKLLQRRGPEWIVQELLQNAWDTDSTNVEMTLEREGKLVRLRVSDDDPTGFTDLSHAFTLFAESQKKGDAEKRGRYNLGEKLVLSRCESATIVSTTGTVVFDASGRRRLRGKSQRGSRFDALLRMSDDEFDACVAGVKRLIPPAGIETSFNGERLAERQPLTSFVATLPTELAGDDGVLRRTARKTKVTVYEPAPGELPSLYELGIPVVETSDRWHVDIGMKVPLNMDRDNVTPAYLAQVRALVLEHMTDRINVEDANATWVRHALQQHGDSLPVETVTKVLDLRFGDKRCAFDPSDREANHRAVAAGYTVVHGSQMSAAEWAAARRAEAILPAGKVTPSPRPDGEDGSRAREYLPREKWTPAVREVVALVERLGPPLIGHAVHVEVANDITWPFAATFGNFRFTFNVGRLGYAWFEGETAPIFDLIVHEFGHAASGNHLSEEYYSALTAIGGKMVVLALREPKLFVMHRSGPAANREGSEPAAACVAG